MLILHHEGLTAVDLHEATLVHGGSLRVTAILDLLGGWTDEN